MSGPALAGGAAGPFLLSVPRSPEVSWLPPAPRPLAGCDMCPDLLQREVAPGVILTKWGEILSEIISSFPRDLA